MSLAREALRIATVRALRNPLIEPWVGARVKDSEHGAIEDWTSANPMPSVLVYTDDAEFGGAQRDMLDGGTVDLTIEIVMTQRAKVHVEEAGDDGWDWTSPQTDAATELIVGALERLVIVSLLDPANAWGEVWRRFALSIGRCKSRRGTFMREGVRFAGRQLVIPVNLPRDPVPGDVIGPVWAAFLARAAATPDLAPVLPLLQSLVAGGAAQPDWQAVRHGWGLTLEEARALQLAPPPAAEGTTPGIAAVVLDTTASPGDVGTLP